MKKDTTLIRGVLNAYIRQGYIKKKTIKGQEYYYILEKKKPIKKTTKHTTPYLNPTSVIMGYFNLALDDDFYSAYIRFRDNRNKTNHKVTEESEKLFFNKLKNIDKRLEKKKLEVAIQMIENALEHSRRTIFPLNKTDTEEFIVQIKKEESEKGNISIEEQEKIRKKEAEKEVDKITIYYNKLSEEEKTKLNKEALQEAKKLAPTLEEDQLRYMVEVAKRKIIRKIIGLG